MVAGVVDNDTLARSVGQVFEDLLGAKDRLGRGGEVLLPCGEGERVVKVFDKETFATAGDEDKGNVGIMRRKVGELSQEMTCYAAGAWKSFSTCPGPDMIVGLLI